MVEGEANYGGDFFLNTTELSSSLQLLLAVLHVETQVSTGSRKHHVGTQDRKLILVASATCVHALVADRPQLATCLLVNGHQWTSNATKHALVAYRPCVMIGVTYERRAQRSG